MKKLTQTTIGLFSMIAASTVVSAGEDTSLKGWAGEAGTYISSEMRYPKMAIHKNEEGAPEFKVTVDREGKVLSLDMTQRSWGSTINRAKRVLKKADFPDLPAHYKGDKLTFAITMQYAIADSAYEYRQLQKNAGNVSTEKLAGKKGPLTASIMILNEAE